MYMSDDVGNNSTALTSLNQAHYYTIPNIYMVTGIGLGVIYLPNLIIMATAKDIRQHSSYKIMIMLGLFDLIQLSIAGPATAVFILIGYPDEKTKSAGAIAIGAYFGYTFMLALLSLDRCLKTWSPYWGWSMVLGGRKLYVFMAVGGALALWFTIVLNFNANSFFCSAIAMKWYYKEEGLWNVASLDQFAGVGVSVFITIMYSLIGIKIRMMRGITIDTGSRKQELNILYQCLANSSTICVMQVFYFIAPLYTSSRWAFFIGHFMWIMTSGLNGVFYIVFNQTLRSRLRRLLFGLSVAKVMPMPMAVIWSTTEASHPKLVALQN